MNRKWVSHSISLPFLCQPKVILLRKYIRLRYLPPQQLQRRNPRHDRPHSTTLRASSGLRPISELIEGDLVLAWDEATGKTGYFVIIDTISHVDAEIVLLTLDGETLETTAEHPFYVVTNSEWLPHFWGGRWVDAGALQIGDDVLQADGWTGEVQSVRVVAQRQPMYNLTVDQAHTFFVGQGQWLVHNAGCGVNFDMKQVQSKFNDHASAFGVTGNWNPANGAKFQQALEAHITGKNTVAIQGMYNRGASKMNVTHYFDPTTGLNVMADQNGNFISGWKLNPDQIKNLLSTGTLGGGN